MQIETKGKFLRYECRVPELSEFASKINLDTEKESRPREESIKPAAESLAKILRRAGSKWICNIEGFETCGLQAAPAKAIHATDLIEMLVSNGINPTIAKWTLFSAVENSDLLAVVQTPRFAWSLDRPKTRLLLKDPHSRNISDSGDATAPIAGDSVVANSDAKPSVGLLVWDRNQKKSKRPAGRPSPIAPDVRKLVVERWNRGDLTKYEDLLRELATEAPVSVKEIRRILDNDRKRQKRKSD
ncbi:MAG: hypothetical protein H0T51_14225 [Pirellulales bacterium]|nr:hypothetical protein [Pirellulales bacterium]